MRAAFFPRARAARPRRAEIYPPAYFFPGPFHLIPPGEGGRGRRGDNNTMASPRGPGYHHAQGALVNPFGYPPLSDISAGPLGQGALGCGTVLSVLCPHVLWAFSLLSLCPHVPQVPESLCHLIACPDVLGSYDMRLYDIFLPPPVSPPWSRLPGAHQNPSNT